jgi:hypothetical protein
MGLVLSEEIGSSGFGKALEKYDLVVAGYQGRTTGFPIHRCNALNAIF